MHEKLAVMSEKKRQHPVAAVTQVLQIIKQNFIAIIAVLFLGQGSGGIFQIFGILPVILFLLVAGILEWWRFTYQIVDGELHIKRGVVVRKNLYLSPERIQVIDINAGVLQRMFGLVSVEVKTAGTQSKNAKLNAVTHEEAEIIKDLLPKSGQQPSEEAEEVAEPHVYKLETKDLIVAAATSGNITLTLAIIGGVLSQALQFVSEEQMIELVKYVLPGSFEMNLAFGFIVLALVVSWLLAFAGTVIRYYGFTLTVFNDELHVETGLFTQRQSTVPFNRIQGIRIEEELMREPFGLQAITLESAGYGERKNNATTLFPLIHKNKLAGFLKEVLPDYNVTVEKKTPPARSLKRYILRPVWLSLLIIIPAWIWVPYGFWSTFLVIPAAILGWAQYQTAAIGVTGNTMVICRRRLSKTTAIIKKHRAMTAENKQNPLQRRLNLTSFSVTIASGSRGRTFIFRDLDEHENYNFFDWITPRQRHIDLE